MESERVDAVLCELVGRDTPTSLWLDPAVDFGFSDIPAHEVDAALREGVARNLAHGERATFAGSEVLWSNPRLRVEGLRHLGEWPPTGGEHLPGPWEDGYWGRRALPALRALSESPPHQGFVFGPEGGMSDEEWAEWCAVLRLREVGLIDGDLEQGGLSDVRVTAAGTRVLDPPERDGLAVADVALRRGGKAEATIAAVEEALGGRLKELAQAHGFALTGAKTLGALNNHLKAAEVYGEPKRAQIEAWLKLRNEVAHGRGEAVSVERIENMVAGVRVFLQDHPIESG